MNYTLIGTTDTDFHGDPNEARSEAKEIEYLLKEVATLYHAAKDRKIEFTYAGVRPLVRSSSRKTESAVSRNYKILNHDSEGLSGLISVLGVKLTSYRLAAKDLVDLVSKKLGRSSRCTTAVENLPGGKGITEYSIFLSAQVPKLSAYGFDEVQTSYLLGNYGARVEMLLELVEQEKALSKRICPSNPQILAEITLAVRSEFALTVSDFMMRRAPIVFMDCRGLDCVETVSEFMGKELGWNKIHIQNEAETYKRNVDLGFKAPPQALEST
jgi:glycerol-3-phosphate dehydrogenase